MATLLKKRTEHAIVGDSFQRISKRKTIKACREVPLLGRCVDLMYISGNSLIAIEFKLFDWRKAIMQSYDHKLGADFAYICILERKVTTNMQKEFQQAGVGLIFYREKGRWPFELVIKAPKSNETWPAVRSRVASYIKNINSE